MLVPQEVQLLPVQDTAPTNYVSAVVAPEFGAMPYTITEDINILFRSSLSSPPKDELYYTSLLPIAIGSITEFRVSDGDGDISNDVVVTGIKINAGVTVTFPSGAGNTQIIHLPNDLQNNGTITSLDEVSFMRSNMRINMSSYFGGPNSEIRLDGIGVGQAGGWAIFNVSDKFINHGTINVAGANNSAGDGGGGGNVTINAINYIENSGRIIATGGHASTGSIDGIAGTVSFVSTAGSIKNAGDIVAPVTFLAGLDSVTDIITPGDIINSGDLGYIPRDMPDGDGIRGGFIILKSFGGSVISSGDLTTRGGDSLSNGDGQMGGSIEIVAYVGIDSNNKPVYPHIILSGNINARGGIANRNSSFSGATGGTISIKVQSAPFGLNPPTSLMNDTNSDSSLRLLGYRQIVSNGGDANIPNDAGSILIESNGSHWNGGTKYVEGPAGPIRNEVDIYSNGGNVLTGSTSDQNGAAGGRILIIRLFTDDSNVGDKSVFNSGHLEAVGGSTLAGFQRGGVSGFIATTNTQSVIDQGSRKMGDGSIGLNGG